MQAKPQPEIENRILLSLSKCEYEKILPNLEWTEFELNKVLWEAGDPMHYAYFINTGMVSLIAADSGGGSVEVGLIGREGLLGMHSVMGGERASHRCLVQIPGKELKINRDALQRHLQNHKALHDQLLYFYQIFHNQISQSVVCNRFHSFEQRLCRWLLMTAKRVEGNEFPLTHESVSLMLGANRATVTATCGNIRKSGLISQRRGLIRILDRKRMETAACECYRANLRDLDDLFRFQKSRKVQNHVQRPCGLNP
jgi:CRP-like cAMP-binding protein